MKKMKRLLVLCLVAAMCVGTMIIPARAAVFGAAEAGQYVDQLYQGLLGRAADDSGRVTYVNKLVNDKVSAASIAEAIVGSAEFRARPLTNEEFITAMYQGLLGRDPDEAGMESFKTAFAVGQSRTWVFKQILASAEFKDVCEQKYSMYVGSYSSNVNIPNTAPTSVTTSLASDYVTRLYTYLLDRPTPDEAGLNYWTTQLTLKKMTAAEVAAGIASSAEFNAKSYTNPEFVQRAYYALLNRQYDVPGFTGYVGALDSGKSRAWVFASICASKEFQQSFGEMNATPGRINSTVAPNSNISGGAVNAALAGDYVDRLYLAFLGGSHYPTAEERDYWVGKLVNRTMSAAGVAASIAASPEARSIPRTRADFVEACYWGLFGRLPEAAGLGAWETALMNGYSRSWVFSKICSSAEFQNNGDLRSMNVTPGYVNASAYDMG